MKARRMNIGVKQGVVAVAKSNCVGDLSHSGCRTQQEVHASFTALPIEECGIFGSRCGCVGRLIPRIDADGQQLIIAPRLER